MSSQDAVSDRFYGALYQALLHPGLVKSAALAQFLGLLFQAVKADVSSKRAAAFVKRLLQVATQMAANGACAALVVASEMLKHKPTLWPALTQPEDSFAAEGCDVDAAAALHAAAHWVVAEWPPAEYYDMCKRAPQHARAERSCMWEAALLAAHAHPSVAAMARSLLAGQNVLYDGDPLRDLTLLAFLDKFVKRCATPSLSHCPLTRPLSFGRGLTFHAHAARLARQLQQTRAHP